MRVRVGITFTLAILVCATVAVGETEARIATYNIKFLKADVGSVRLDKIKQVIDLLEADIIALQEIDDRAALEKVFDKTKWHLIIDDDSGQRQDLAFAVRKDWTLPQFQTDEDADAAHFLFPSSSDNNLFPNRRDVLAVKVQPETGIEFVVMVVHAKSRFGGRATTESRRVGAAQALVDKFKAEFDDVPFVLLGDFNDNPDDRSLNILETGSHSATGGPEQIVGPFLINLTEPLCVAGHVSHGLKSDAVSGDSLDTIDPGSRDRNNNARGTNTNTGDILFDQILIPAWMIGFYVDGSATVFDHAVAAKGNNTTRASDHAPVYADFVFTAEGAGGTAASGLHIASLLPNPEGTDNQNERVTLRNTSSQVVTLSDWKLVDKAGNEFAFTGSIPPNSILTVVMKRSAMLNNLGDTVWLVDKDNKEHSKVTYTSSQAKPGIPVVID